MITDVRIALRDNASRLHRDDLVGVAAGVVEVVQHGDHGAALLAVEHGEQVEQFHLMGDVEEGRRLVEQHERGLLGQHHGHPDPLALTAGQFVDQVGRRRPVTPVQRIASATASLVAADHWRSTF